MNIWLIVFLLMSLTLNILQFKESVKKEKMYKELEAVYKDFDKIVKKYNTKFTKKEGKK